MKSFFLRLKYLIFFLIFLEVLLRIFAFSYSMFYQKATFSLVNEQAYKNILCIGESTTFGMGAGPLESYPYILQKLINNSSLKFKYKVHNLGIPGMKSYKILEGLISNIKKYKPSLIIFLFGANELEGKEFIGRYNFEKYKSSLFLNFVSRSKLVRMSLVFYDRFLIKLKYDICHKRIATLDSTNLKIQELIFKEYARNTRSIITTCRQNNVPFVFSKYLFVSVTGESNYALDVLSKRYNFILIKQPEYVKEKAIDEKILFSDNHWHPNAKGYKIMAENIFRTIKENKLIE